MKKNQALAPHFLVNLTALKFKIILNNFGSMPLIMAEINVYSGDKLQGRLITFTKK